MIIDYVPIPTCITNYLYAYKSSVVICSRSHEAVGEGRTVERRWRVRKKRSVEKLTIMLNKKYQTENNKLSWIFPVGPFRWWVCLWWLLISLDTHWPETKSYKCDVLVCGGVPKERNISRRANIHIILIFLFVAKPFVGNISTFRKKVSFSVVGLHSIRGDDDDHQKS